MQWELYGLLSAKYFLVLIKHPNVESTDSAPVYDVYNVNNVVFKCLLILLS